MTDIHQDLMDSAYHKWQTIWKNVGYSQFIKNCSEKERMAVLLGNLNYQVCNGGWCQWVDNGYCTQYQNIRAILKNNAHKYPTFAKVLDQMDQVILHVRDDVKDGDVDSHGMSTNYWKDEEEDTTCCECNGFGVIEDDEEEGEDCDCPRCGGSGEVTDEDSIPDFGELDKEFFAVSDQYQVECNRFFSNM